MRLSSTLSKKIALNGALAAASLVLGLGAVEIGLRLADFPPRDFSPWVRMRDTAFGYAANFRGRMRHPGEYDVAFETNALGLRDDEIGPKSGFRVLVLGDSFTSGYGVDRGAMFVDRIERELGVDVVNASVGGYEIIHQVHYYSERGRALAPDLVLYLLYLGNDIARNGEWHETADGGLAAETRVYPVREERDWKLPRLVMQARYGLRLRREGQREEWTPFPDYLAMCARQLDAPSIEAYRQSERLLARLDEAVRQSGSRFVVALFSYRTSIEPDARARFLATNPGYDALYDLQRPERRIRTFLERKAITYLDLNPALRERHSRPVSPSDVLYFPRDGHFTARGHELVAAELTSFLRGQHLVP